MFSINIICDKFLPQARLLPSLVLLLFSMRQNSFGSLDFTLRSFSIVAFLCRHIFFEMACL